MLKALGRGYVRISSWYACSQGGLSTLACTASNNRILFKVGILRPVYVFGAHCKVFSRETLRAHTEWLRIVPCMDPTLSQGKMVWWTISWASECLHVDWVM